MRATKFFRSLCKPASSLWRLAMIFLNSCSQNSRSASFPLPQFFFHPVFQLFDQSFVHITPIIDYLKSAILSIIRLIIGKKLGKNQLALGGLPALPPPNLPGRG